MFLEIIFLNNWITIYFTKEYKFYSTKSILKKTMLTRKQYFPSQFICIVTNGFRWVMKTLFLKIQNTQMIQIVK